MADRYIRSALLQSDKFNALDHDAQCFFVRLVLAVDDYGCFDGRTAMIAAHCYPLGRTEAMPLEPLYKAEFVLRYANAGRNFIAITQWGETLRGFRKYPAPPVNNDKPGIKYRGVYGRPMNWVNPRGSDPTSVLLDSAGRVTAPQPPEWRRVGTDWMPMLAPQQPQPLVIEEDTQIVSKGGGKRSVPAQPVSTHSGPEQPVSTQSVSEAQRQGGNGGSPTSRLVVKPSFELSYKPSSEPSKPSVTEKPPETAAVVSATSTAATSGNGGIEFVNGVWKGISEAQEVRWQGIAPHVAVPDALVQAAAWLEVNPDARTRCEAGQDTWGQFLVRWILREEERARTHAPSKGKH